ncbi:uncharacterized protein LOC142775416 [Rhipicephalus microplus]|uniref:uncharacterized protein LOC142775416 n=1 Tax=Rhipicephalus microplus TaxID=6941 RepID=UPI003F6B468D
MTTGTHLADKGGKIVSMDTERVLSMQGKRREHNLSREECKAIHALRNDDKVVILPADKGNAVVLLDREAYNDKVRDLLDSPAYEELTKDPTPSVQREMNKLLADIFKAHPKARNTYLQLICRNGSAPGFYGLPKTHKPTVPLRPIVDFTTSPLRALSKYLHRTLAPLVGQTPTHIRDASHFLERMRDVTMSSDDCFVSFDVVHSFLPGKILHDARLLAVPHCGRFVSLPCPTRLPCLVEESLLVALLDLKRLPWRPKDVWAQ